MTHKRDCTGGKIVSASVEVAHEKVFLQAKRYLEGLRIGERNTG